MSDAPKATKAELQHLRSLREASARRDTGLCLVEGERSLDAALDAGAVPLLVVIERRRLDVPAVVRSRAAGARVVLADAQKLERVSDRAHAPGLAATVPIPDPWSLAALSPSGPALVVGLCGLQDPGNVGTIVRSGLAFGARAALLAPGTADPFAPKVVRATAGAVFSFGIGRAEDNDAWPALAASASLELVAAAAPQQGGRGEVSELPARCLLLLGHETRGVPTHGARTVTIDHEASVESLNVAMAGAILMSRWYASTRAP